MKTFEEWLRDEIHRFRMCYLFTDDEIIEGLEARLTIERSLKEEWDLKAAADEESDCGAEEEDGGCSTCPNDPLAHPSSSL